MDEDSLGNTSSGEDEEEEKEILNKFNLIGEIPLTKKKKEILEEILKNLNLKNKEIKIALVFCYENVKSSSEIIEKIYEILKNCDNINEKVNFISKKFILFKAFFTLFDF